MVSLGSKELILTQPYITASFLSTRYVPLEPSRTSTNIKCTENTVVFEVSIFQYVGLAVALSTAAPYRKPLFTNCKYMASV